MTSSRDSDRLIRAFLEEGRTELPDRVYDTVRAEIDQTSQRVVIGPWRMPYMTSYAKLAIATAAVAVVAFVGINLLPRSGGPGGPGLPSASPSPTPHPTGQPISALDRQAGLYIVMVDGIAVSIALPSDWVKAVLGQTGGAILDRKPEASTSLFIWNPDNVYADPCKHITKSPHVGPGAPALAAAMTAIPGTDTIEPLSVEAVGGRTATHLAISIPEDSGCAGGGPAGFRLWYNEDSDDGCVGDVECPRFATALGDRIEVWVVDVGGKRVVIEAETPSDVTAAVKSEIQDIIASIQFE